MSIRTTTSVAPSRAQKIVPWVILALILVLMVVGRITEFRATGEPEGGWILDGFMGLAFMSFPAVGALIVTRRPGHRFGWLLLCIGASAAILVAASGYTQLALIIWREPSPLATLTAWISGWLWFPLLAMVAIFVFLLFPTGTYPSSRWRWVGRLSVAAVAVITVPSMFQGRLEDTGYSIDNPIGIGALQDVEEAMEPLFFVWIVLVLASIASLVFRYREGGTEQRQQLKWVGLAAAVFAVGIIVGEQLVLVDDLFGLFMMGIPIAMAISILKYRLYDIDVILNRALVYGALTAILAGAYLGIVFALQQILPVGDDSDIAVAASTLAVAALFRPLRERVQGFIDRRFFRHRYDSAATLQSFAARLRNEVELGVVQDDLLRITAETVQPKHASLWLVQERVPGGAG